MKNMLFVLPFLFVATSSLFATDAMGNSGARNFASAEFHYNRGLDLFDKGDYEGAERYLLSALSIFETIFGRGNTWFAVTLYNLGKLFYATGNFTRAERYFLEALNIFESVLGRENTWFVSTLGQLGWLFSTIGDFAEAERYFLEALSIYERLFGRDHHFANTLNNLGNLFSHMGDFARAERYYLEALSIYERLFGREHLNFATTLNNLGVVFYRMGDRERAERYYLEVLSIVEINFGREHYQVADMLNNLGYLYRNMGDFARAEQYLLEALNIRERLFGKEHHWFALSLSHLGRLYSYVGYFDKAESYFLEAINIQERVFGREHPRVAISLNHLGKMYRRKGYFDRAEAYLLEALNIQERILGREHHFYINTVTGLYKLHLTTRNFAQAFYFKLKDNQLRTGMINRSFSFLSERQRNLFWDINEEAFELTYSLSFHHPVPENNSLSYDNALFSKGLLLRTTNAVRDAIFSSGDEELIAQFEQLGRLRQQISNLRQGDGNQEFIQTLEQQAEQLERFLTQSSAAFREFQEDLAVNWQNVRDSLHPEEAAIEFVSFRIYDNGWTDTTMYAALVLRHDFEAPAWVPLFEEDVVTGILSMLPSGQDIDRVRVGILYHDFGLGLFEAIWEPLEEHLDGVTRIFYSPSGILHQIAFNAIPVSEPEIAYRFDEEFDEYYEAEIWTFLMDVYELNLVSSTREIVNRRIPRAPVSAVVYGGLYFDVEAGVMVAQARQHNMTEPVIHISQARTTVATTRGGDGTRWDFLPGSDAERIMVREILNRNNIEPLVFHGISGNEESFRALDGNSPSIIHIATHGFFLEDIERSRERREMLERVGGRGALENPLFRSGLVFSGGNSAWTGSPVEGIEDGILYAYEIAQMNLLGTDLVLLAACETGLGTVNNSEGVFGLQRAFKLAGAQTIIMSLWKVGDEATAILITEFYENWLSGMGIQEAFRQAQKYLRNSEEFGSPFYWAAFVVMD